MLGRDEGESIGRAKGFEQAKMEIARNLLAKGWTAEETAETAKLSIEQVRALIR
jgi:predicted transposase YdaD